MSFYVAFDQLFVTVHLFIVCRFRLFLFISSTLYAYRGIYMYSFYYWYVVQSLELSQMYCYKHSCASHLVNVTTFFLSKLHWVVGTGNRAEKDRDRAVGRLLQNVKPKLLKVKKNTIMMGLERKE